MTSGRRTVVFALMGVGVALGVRASLGIYHDGGDYENQAGPALDALVRGDLHEFFAIFPVIGPLTMFLRAPVLALFFHADVRVVYLTGAAVCFVPLVALALWLARQVRDKPDIALATVVLVIANPLTFRVIHWGHPEDYVAATATVGSGLALLRGRPGLAGLLLGLAFASKQWAILAAPVLLVAAGSRWLRLAAIAAVVSVVFYLPLALGNPDHFVEVMKGASNPQAFYSHSMVHGALTDPRDRPVPGMTHATPLNVWWLAAVPHRELIAHEVVRSGLVHDWMVVLGHALAAVGALIVAFVLARRGRAGREDVLLGLALVFLIRCLLDPLDFDYHHLPFCLSLVAWETFSCRRLPVLSAAVAFAFGVMFLQPPYSFVDLYRHSLFYSSIYLVWALPLAVAMAVRLAGRRGPVRTYVRPWSSASSSTGCR